MDSSRNIVLGAMIIAIGLGVIYMIDPTLMGLLRRKEGFLTSGGVTNQTGPGSAIGLGAGMFNNSGDNDASEINNNSNVAEGFADTESVGAAGCAPPKRMVDGTCEGFGEKDKEEAFADYSPSEMPFPAAAAPAGCYPKNQLAPSELLPGDPNSKWAQVNPQGQGDIAGKNFLNAGSLVGVNTVGSSLRNASWDLRSEVPNPQVNVSPWQNTTISPDIFRRPMEIG